MLQQGLSVPARGAEQVAGFGQGELARRFHGGGQPAHKGVEAVRRIEEVLAHLDQPALARESVDNPLGFTEGESRRLSRHSHAGAFGGAENPGRRRGDCRRGSGRAKLPQQPLDRVALTRIRSQSGSGPAIAVLGAHRLAGALQPLEGGVERRPFLPAGQLAPQLTQGQVGVQRVGLRTGAQGDQCDFEQGNSDGP
jgi:hypothetical protein